MQKLLITGISGLLGNNLAFALKDRFRIAGFYHTHPIAIDGVETLCVPLASESFFTQAVERFAPDIVVHCASLTDVDYCETHQERTRQINVEGTATVVKSVAGSQTKLVYISSDSVYGDGAGHFTESSPLNPLNYYGWAKLEGEQVALRHPNTLVLRTNIFGWNIQDKYSLGEWIIQQLQQQRAIRCFSDVYFSSIYTMRFAQIMASMLAKDLRGIYNCASRTACSKYEFAEMLAECFHLDRSLIAPASINEFQFVAKRGKQLALDVSKLEAALGEPLPPIQASVRQFHQDYHAGTPTHIKHNAFPRTHNDGVLPYGCQFIDEVDIQAICNVLRSHYLTTGPKAAEFESALCACTGAKYAVVVNSATAALHLACLVGNVGPGDEVVTSPNTFVASANCAAYCGAKPVFADIDARTYNLDPQQLQTRLNEKTKAIIPVHFAGQSCDMDAIAALRRDAQQRYGRKILLIEDASHALGSTYQGHAVGDCAFADMVVASFHPVKHITTGEGGVIFTNDEDLYKRLRRLRSHGIEALPHKEGAGPWYYEQLDLGFNYRITDLQCALGISQLAKLPQFMQRRREIIALYNEALRHIDVMTLPYEAPGRTSNFHLYVTLVDFAALGMTRKEFMLALRERKITTQVHYIPVHTQPYYQKQFGYRVGDYPIAEKYYAQCLSLPLFPAMTDEHVQQVIAAIRSVTGVQQSTANYFV